jgi:hypothetical protein
MRNVALNQPGTRPKDVAINRIMYPLWKRSSGRFKPVWVEFHPYILDIDLVKRRVTTLVDRLPWTTNHPKP